MSTRSCEPCSFARSARSASVFRTADAKSRMILRDDVGSSVLSPGSTVFVCGPSTRHVIEEAPFSSDRIDEDHFAAKIVQRIVSLIEGCSVTLSTTGGYYDRSCQC
jgi:hypothetical protein